MQVHSRVGVITNSSSEIYTEITADYESALMAIGQKILDALGDPRKAEDVFEVTKTKTGYREAPEGEELPLNSENYMGFLDANYRVALVAKDTGIEFDFMQFFDRLYSQESAYNG